MKLIFMMECIEMKEPSKVYELFLKTNGITYL